MIRNSNVAQNAGIDPSKIAGGWGFFVPNNVRRVVQTSSTNFKYANKIIDMMPSGMVYTGVTGHKAAIEDCDEADVVYIHAGDSVYRAGAATTISANRIKIFGQQTSMFQWGSPSIGANAGTYNAFIINAHQCEMAGIGIHMQTAYPAITVGSLQANWRTHIHDCYFGGNQTGTYGVDCGLTYDAPYSVIERCKFEDWATACIRMNAHHSAVINSIFFVYTAKIGIDHIPNSADRPNSEYIGNKFHCTDPTNGYGIKVTNTPTAGMIYIDDNHFTGFADDGHCISKLTTGYLGMNWNDVGGTNGAPIQEA